MCSQPSLIIFISKVQHRMLFRVTAAAIANCIYCNATPPAEEEKECFFVFYTYHSSVTYLAAMKCSSFTSSNGGVVNSCCLVWCPGYTRDWMDGRTGSQTGWWTEGELLLLSWQRAEAVIATGVLAFRAIFLCFNFILCVMWFRATELKVI